MQMSRSLDDILVEKENQGRRKIFFCTVRKVCRQSLGDKPREAILKEHPFDMMNRLDKYYEAQPQQMLRRAHNTTLMLPPPPLVDTNTSSNSRSSTWTSYNKSEGFSILERGERIKPERTNKRNNVQKMQWRSSRWVNGFPYAIDEDIDQRISSMTIADVSPRFAVKRIILLYENFQYREAANFINRLSHGTFKVILNDLPIDLFVESMPHSLSILEALYAKVFLSDGLNFSMKLLRPEGVIMQMVRFFSAQDKEKSSWDSFGPFVSSCKKLLKVIVLSDPKIRKILQQKRRSLDKAIEGLGQHGLVGTSDESLMNLHDALKVEFSRVVETYKEALQKLEDLSLSTNNSTGVNRGPAPVQSSHQRQLSLRQPEIQGRLIKNKTLLNVVEPTLGNHSLDILLGILQRRVEFDKDVLFQFTQLKKEMKEVDPAEIVAPVLLRYSHGCDQVLELMKEVADDDDSSDISGYHSDSDSAIMMSGNSPYISKRARHNFLTRSVRSSNKSSMCRTSVLLHHQLSSSSGVSSQTPNSMCGSESPPEPTAHPDTSSTSSGNSGPLRPRQLKHKKELHKLNSAGSSSSSSGTVACCEGCQPRASLQVLPPSSDEELATLRAELEGIRSELSRANTRLVVVQESEKGLKERLATSTRSPAVPDREVAERLVRYYGSLYATARVDTLDALDNLPPLRDAHELKSKILFSVIVLAFRSSQALLAMKKDHIRRVLHITPPAPCDGVSPPNTTVQSPVESELERQVELYLRRTVEMFDLTKCGDEVCSQIWATLYDYPCLKDCPGLVQYVRNAVRLSWGLVNQSPPFILEYEQRVFRKDVHVRFHTSDPESDQIRTYLWPALLEGCGGPCVHKAVVVT